VYPQSHSIALSSGKYGGGEKTRFNFLAMSIKPGTHISIFMVTGIILDKKDSLRIELVNQHLQEFLMGRSITDISKTITETTVRNTHCCVNMLGVVSPIGNYIRPTATAVPTTKNS